MSEPVADAPAPAKRTLKERLSAHMAEYGKIAVYTYLVLSLLTITGFSIAIGMGIEPSSASGVLGVIGAGWLAAKATLPIRILITLGLTPLVAAVVRRWWPVKPADADDDDDAADE
ncbi:hypothetical protein BH11MYX3_BH11MYX3_02070 [soil metagenome]